MFSDHSHPWRAIFVWCFLSVILASPTLAGAAAEAFEVGPYEVDELPGGKEADGIIGDFVLRNDRVEVVISGNMPLRRANMSTFYGTNGITPGCLYDLTLRDSNNDQITIFAPAGQSGSVSWVRIGNPGSGGAAVIETIVAAARNNGLYKRHEYRLRDGWQGVLITTTIRNEADQPRQVPVRDRWTTFQRSGTLADVTWADAIDPADKTGYAFGITEGKDLIGPTNTVELSPSQQIAWTRFLAVGTSPADALGLVARRLGAVGRVAGIVLDGDGAAVGTAHIVVRAGAGATATNCIAYPDEAGQFSFALPPAQYELEFADVGRPSIKQRVDIRARRTSTVDVEMAVASAVLFDIRDKAGRGLPCKAQFHGVEGTPSPYLGPENRAHGCVDQYHSAQGQFRVPLPAGRYKIIVTRGVEYSRLERVVTVEPGRTVRFEGVLQRVVDTAGWVSADYHNHSTPSGDNTCGTDDRVINLAAEHIEFAPTTEHNRFYDWAPHIQRLGLRDFVQTVPGIELTGSGPHLNAFPFNPVPFTQDGGAPVWNPDPRISAITLRDWQGAEPDRWVQINHPDMVENFIDRDADGKEDGGFHGLAQLIDGIETQNYAGSSLLEGRPFRVGTNNQGREMVFYLREFIWLQMLNRGHRYAAMAVNDAHSVYGNGVGSWRMYLPSKSDHPPEIDWRENSRHAKAGRSILTTGPFLQVETGDGVLPGGAAQAAGGGVKLKVKVQCTDWIDIDRVQVLVNGRAPKELNFTRATHADWFADGVTKFERAIDIPLAEDAHLIVVAIGEKFDLSIGYGTSPQARIKPCAYNNPIFVDVDGGGFKPNGDTLDWDLPVKRLSVDDVRRLTR